MHRIAAGIATTALSASLMTMIPGAASAAAAGWSWNPPTKATSVETRLQKTFGSGSSKKTVQFRKGKYGGTWYMWGRAFKPGSNINGAYDIYFAVNNGLGLVQGDSRARIDGTTYTKAFPLKTNYRYMACIVPKGKSPISDGPSKTCDFIRVTG
ncbi:hypothetical protein ACQP2T_04160 [Nonomuraea sp. CA-143628]|uniref:hypothetical protein n=1 Tax=Nonomuraea sp. CA-143628 TaxID=3239997 RepID=UPI003D8CDDF7